MALPPDSYRDYEIYPLWGNNGGRGIANLMLQNHNSQSNNHQCAVKLVNGRGRCCAGLDWAVEYGLPDGVLRYIGDLSLEDLNQWGLKREC